MTVGVPPFPDAVITSGSCFWLDMATRRCIHYAERPPECVEFEVGSDRCVMHRSLVAWQIML